MNPEYSNLKLIIETPTQEAWDKVTEFFGCDFCPFDMALASTMGDAQWPQIRISPESYQKLSWWKGFDRQRYSDHEYITYPEFEARFLNADGVEVNIDRDPVAIVEQMQQQVNEGEQLLTKMDALMTDLHAWREMFSLSVERMRDIVNRKNDGTI